MNMADRIAFSLVVACILIAVPAIMVVIATTLLGAGGVSVAALAGFLFVWRVVYIMVDAADTFPEAAK
jgi:hypothetical protein